MVKSSPRPTLNKRFVLVTTENSTKVETAVVLCRANACTAARVRAVERGVAGAIEALGGVDVIPPLDARTRP